MAKREVAICTLDEETGAEVEIGRLRIKDGVLVADPKDEPMLEGLLDEAITVPDEEGEPRTYRASKDPEAFLEALMRHYRSPYLRACRAETAKKTSAAYARTREPNAYEQKVDFAQIEEGQDGLEGEGKARLMEVLERMREALLGTVGKRLEAGDLTPMWVRNLDLKFKGELQRVAREILGEGYRLGSREGRRMLREKRLQVRLVPGIPPEKALAFFEQKAFYITGVLKDRLLNGARNVLYNGIKNGTPGTDVIRELKELFDEYLGDPTAIAPGKEEQAQPYRLETILRTNVNEAYNEGLKDGVDEEVESGFVIGFLYSAIIDGRQTEVCEFLDGKILRPDTEDTNALTPANHFNALPAGTKVLARRALGQRREAAQWWPIEAIQAGWLVLTHRNRWRAVTETMAHATWPEEIVLHLEGGKTLTLTDDHPILTKRGWVHAGDLREMDEVVVVGVRCGACGAWTENRRFCSAPCRHRAQRRPRRCLLCGREIPVRGKNRARWYCSARCMGEAMRTLPPMRCATCDAPMVGRWKRPVSRARRFCDRRCWLAYRGETRLEATVREGLAALGVPAIPQMPFGRYVVDFWLPDARLVVEVDGDYWHTIKRKPPETIERRQAYLLAEGCRILHLSQDAVGSGRYLDLLKGALDETAHVVRAHRAD